MVIWSGSQLNGLSLEVVASMFRRVGLKSLKQSVALGVVWGCSCFLDVQNFSYFYHEFRLKLPTLIRV